jgi:hypothetical protein
MVGGAKMATVRSVACAGKRSHRFCVSRCFEPVSVSVDQIVAVWSSEPQIT